MKTINIIGCGRLGKTLGYLLAKSHQVQVQQICNKTVASATAATAFIGQGHVCVDITTLAPADIYLITTKDAQIADVCNTIIQNTQPLPDAVFLHCSGSLSSDVLHAAKDQGYNVASIHPNRSFAAPEQSIHTFNGTLCAVEGDAIALEILMPLFSHIGGVCFPIEKKNKALYHAAAVIANNYAVGLFSAAIQTYALAGVDEKKAHMLVHRYMHDALHHLQHHTPEQALTGPLQRGDVATVAAHLDALSASAQLLELYKVLGETTLGLTDLPADVRGEIEGLFN